MEADGWKWNFAAGFVPLLAGLLVLLTSWWSMSHSDTPWFLGISSLNFSFDQLRATSSAAGPFVEVLGSVGGVNIVAGAVAVIVVSRFAVRRGQAWAWWFLFFCFIWVGLHDAWSATKFFLHTGNYSF